MNNKIILGLMLVLVLISSASAKNYGILDYMFDKNITFTDPIGKTMSELLEGARFFTLIHEDGSLERVGLQEESFRDGFDEDEISKRDKIRRGFGALVRRNYSIDSKPVFNEDMVGTAKVLVNKTEAQIIFQQEYENAPIVTVTPIGLPNFFYGVDEITTKGFKILISDTQEKEIVFNWHAFGQSSLVVNETFGNVPFPNGLETNVSKTKKDIIEINKTKIKENGIINETVEDIAEVEENITEVIENITEENIIEIIENITEDNITEITEENITKTININLEYKSGTLFDADNNGIANLTNIIDFTVENSLFNLDENNLCTRYSIESLDNKTKSFICYGNEECCNFVELIPILDNWNDPLNVYVKRYDAGLDNIISAQVLFYNISHIYYSDWSNLTAKFIEDTIEEDIIKDSTQNLITGNVILDVSENNLLRDLINFFYNWFR